MEGVVDESCDAEVAEKDGKQFAADIEGKGVHAKDLAELADKGCYGRKEEGGRRKEIGEGCARPLVACYRRDARRVKGEGRMVKGGW